MIVDGGVYAPATIEVGRGQSVILNFICRDASPCAEKLVFADLGISVDLSLAEPKTLALRLDDVGEYDFSCQMGMYRGKLIVT